MKTVIASLAILASVNAFAVSECKNVGTNTPYNGQITEESREVSYKGCPESVLVNDKFVANLFIVQDSEGNPTCGYKFGMVTFLCENK